MAQQLDTDQQPNRQKLGTKRQRRVVVITGASSGIGRAAAQAFAREGADVALLARGREGLEGAKQEVESLGGRGLVIPTDVSDADAVEAAAEQTEREFGPIDVWVNNAVVTMIAPVKEMTPEQFKRIAEVGYLGIVYGTLAALKRMLPRDRGSIIQIGSALSYRGIPLNSAYCAAQHAVQGFCDSLRTELMHDNSNVSVTMIRPSGINTPLWLHSLCKMPHLPKPIGRLYQPELVANAIVWASKHRRREMSVGWESIKAIWGDKLIPAFADWDLARSGYARQQATEMDLPPDREGNLWKPSPGDPGSHGPYDDRAKRHSLQLWATMHRPWLILAGAALLTSATALGFKLIRSSRMRKAWW